MEKKDRSASAPESAPQHPENRPFPFGSSYGGMGLLPQKLGKGFGWPGAGGSWPGLKLPGVLPDGLSGQGMGGSMPGMSGVIPGMGGLMPGLGGPIPSIGSMPALHAMKSGSYPWGAVAAGAPIPGVHPSGATQPGGFPPGPYPSAFRDLRKDRHPPGPYPGRPGAYPKGPFPPGPLPPGPLSPGGCTCLQAIPKRHTVRVAPLREASAQKQQLCRNPREWRILSALGPGTTASCLNLSPAGKVPASTRPWNRLPLNP